MFRGLVPRGFWRDSRRQFIVSAATFVEGSEVIWQLGNHASCRRHNGHCVCWERKKGGGGAATQCVHSHFENAFFSQT